MEEKKDLETKTPVVSEKREKKVEKFFTQDDLNKVLQERLAEEKSKSEIEKQKAVEQARLEAERLATLSQEEKQKEMTEKQREFLESKEREIQLRENKLDAIAKLDELKMPIKFAEFVINEDKQTMFNRIDELNKAWTSSLNEAVADQLKGSSPKDISSKAEKKVAKVISAF